MPLAVVQIGNGESQTCVLDERRSRPVAVYVIGRRLLPLPRIRHGIVEVGQETVIFEGGEAKTS